MSLMRVSDVAVHLAVNEDTVRRLARSGQLAGSQLGGRWRFAMEDVDAFVGERRNTSATPVRRRRRRAHEVSS